MKKTVQELVQTRRFAPGNQARLYFESHVTMDPVFDADRDKLAAIVKPFGFKLANLIMRKREADGEQPHQDDTFATAHGSELAAILERTRACVRALSEHGFVVRRYKVEDTVVDSRIEDELGLLENSNGRDDRNTSA